LGIKGARARMRIMLSSLGAGRFIISFLSGKIKLYLGRKPAGYREWEKVYICQ
jgi:hypothetical protein